MSHEQMANIIDGLLCLSHTCWDCGESFLDDDPDTRICPPCDRDRRDEGGESG